LADAEPFSRGEKTKKRESELDRKSGAGGRAGGLDIRAG
jgi:hypothetical protein